MFVIKAADWKQSTSTQKIQNQGPLFQSHRHFVKCVWKQQKLVNITFPSVSPKTYQTGHMYRMEK